MDDNYGIIYLITNTVNGKVYVGQTIQTIEIRWKDHCYKSEAGCTGYFQNSIRKHGPDSFEIEVIDSAKSRSELNLIEILYIFMFQSSNRKYGYNSTTGGEFFEPTLETRQKMSRAHKGKTGRTPSEETRIKISQTLTGVKHTDERRSNISKSLIGNTNGPASEKNIQMLRDMAKRNTGNKWNVGKKQPASQIEKRMISIALTKERKREKARMELQKAS